MVEVQDGLMDYVCVNTHDIKIDNPDLGPNLDLLLEYLKRPWLTTIAGIVPKSYQNQP